MIAQSEVSHLGPKVPIPDKLYFKIGEVAELVGVQCHVLRYWEKEIPVIRPGKSRSNQRRYRQRDIEIFREVRRLLYDERYTLAGAKKRLSGRSAVASEGTEGDLPPQFAQLDAADLAALRHGLEELIQATGEAL